MRFILSGNHSLEEFAVLLARISLGVFFAISGGNKLFVASQHKLMYETIIGAGIPFPQVMTYFVSSVEFVCRCLLVIGLHSGGRQPRMSRVPAKSPDWPARLSGRIGRRELAHRFAAEEQRHFLKAGPVAIGTGGKYGRPRALRATSAEAKPIG
jgi:hypothetical protein